MQVDVSFYYENTYALIRIINYGFRKYILSIDFKIHYLGILKTGMILASIRVNNMGSHNVCTH
jgi:hypothetical protein